MTLGKGLALALAAYALAVVACAPATLMDSVVSRASHGLLRVAEARGLVWRGHGYLEVVDARNASAIAKAIDWRVKPLALWRGVVAFDVRLAGAPSTTTIAASFRKVDIANIALDVPAAALALAVPQLAAAQLTGDITLIAPRVTVDGGMMQADADVAWRNAGSGLTPVAPLGEYSMQIRSERDGIHARLATVSGPLQLEGEGSWRRHAGPSFSTTAHVAPEYSEALSPMLQSLAGASTSAAFKVVLR